MSKSITQDMRYRQSLMQYAEKYGVSRASRKYNKSRSYIYFWKARWDGSMASLACQSRRPHHHPNQHTEAELKLIRDMRRRNPTLGMVELWHRLRKRGYTRCPESLFRVMRKLGMFPQPKVKAAYKAKPYEQMQYPGQRVQVDVKVVPLKCLTNPEERLYQYTAIDEYTRLRYLGAYPEQSTYSSADFLEKMVAWFKRRGVRVECVQTDNGIEFTNRFSTNNKWGAVHRIAGGFLFLFVQLPKSTNKKGPEELNSPGPVMTRFYCRDFCLVIWDVFCNIF